MSFAIWRQKPPFTFTDKDAEQMYEVGAYWVVTDDPSKATQDNIDAVLNAPQPRPKITNDRLAELLVQKAILSQSDIDSI